MSTEHPQSKNSGQTHGYVHSPSESGIRGDERSEEGIQALVDIVGLESKDLLGSRTEANQFIFSGAWGFMASFAYYPDMSNSMNALTSTPLLA